ncbi:MAG: LysE family translocator [Pseudomonadota bacterium]
MTYEILIALAGFALVTSITPGPNNLMLMASGANFGLRRTIPHMLGVVLGFVFMASLVGIGLAQIFDAYPILHTVLKAVSVLYLLWLAWKIANASPANMKDEAGSPLTFLQAAGFQWVNPKAWSMALTAVTVYSPGVGALNAVLVAVVFGLVNLPAIGSWAMIGVQMQRVLTNPARLRAFNWTMAGLLVLSLWPVLVPQGTP